MPKGNEKIRRATEAERQLERAVRLHKSVADANPKSDRKWDKLAGSYTNLATLLREQGQTQRMEKMLRRSLAIHQRLVQKYPSGILFREHMAKSYANLAITSTKVGDILDNWEKCLKLRVALQDENPDIPKFREQVGKTYSQMAISAYQIRGSAKPESFEFHTQQGMESGTKAVQIFEALFKKHDQRSDFWRQLAVAETTLGNLSYSVKPRTADEWYRKAITHFETKDVHVFKDAFFRRNLVVAYWGHAELRTQNADWETALRS